MPATPNMSHTEPQAVQGNERNSFALVALTSLFFMWGFITSMNDILIPYLKSMFELSFTQAMLVQFCFFGAYFVVSLPAGYLVSRIGYQKGIVTGLLVAALGSGLFYPSASLASYWLFLLAFFILASGITILQVAANPYVSVIGKPETASSRLTLTQAFNSLGTTVAPLIGGWLIFSDAMHSASAPQPGGEEVQLPYLALMGLLILLALVFFNLTLPRIKYEVSGGKITDVLRFPHLKLGAVGIFAYVGAEVGIGSFLVSFMMESHIGGLTEAEASKYVSWYFGGAMTGRFIGAWVMSRIEAGKVLATHAIMAAILVTVAMMTDGNLAAWSLVAVGLFNSIMFPTIFSLSIKDLGASTSHGSGILCLAIVGGAIVPLLQGLIADSSGIQAGFILPIVCYIFIIYFGIKGCHLRPDNRP
ncbi:sugar MFS transporter [Shewanella submarina]|uniref:Sugar MFS transporter n=1 Tax=Shewanella submarina TaxID=2016376 RepID=A0ABV7GBA5_9GAMM|nr:sugar MFS transporter [Shewanella submarina]MCL1037007.1 sugar MFS transporter [Shewanella submarina]